MKSADRWFFSMALAIVCEWPIVLGLGIWLFWMGFDCLIGWIKYKIEIDIKAAEQRAKGVG